MTRKYVLAVCLLSIFFTFISGFAAASLSILEEDRNFWNDILKDESINNKNLLYASYIAYKEKLSDLSIETFRECISINPNNDAIKGLSYYYIGKNLYMQGKYQDSINNFTKVDQFNLKGYEFIKFAAEINKAISYYQLNQVDLCRESLQNVISEDKEGTFKRKAMDILTSIN